jgi:hypothetical protein
LGGLVSGIGTLLSKPPKPVAGPPPVTPNMAAQAAMSDTMMRQRPGAGATELVGRGAGEARTPGGKVLLGQ